ncbi:MAG: hypothetical protein ACOC32_04570, partial [Nanoarchaeota archaeon]
HKIASIFSITREEVDACLQEEIKHAHKIKTAALADLSGKKVIYNVASSLDFSVSTFAQEGLLALGFFREMGFDIQLLVQGNPEESHRKEVENILKSKEINEPVAMLGHCGDGYRHFNEYQDGIVFGSPLMNKDAEEQGLQFINNHSFEIGLKGFEKNVEIMTRK